MNEEELIIQRFNESIELKKKIINDEILIKRIVLVADELIKAIKRGNKLIICGNGGSASDALHFAGELLGKFQKERPAFAAIVLNADVATITSISNDYGYEDVYARQAEGYTRPGDIFMGISTSGNSENIFRAVKVAKKKGAVTVALLGRDGGRINDEVDNPIIVRGDSTARVQESHICIIHAICELVEEGLSKESLA